MNRRASIAESLYYNWSKEFLEAGKQWLTGEAAGLLPTSEEETYAVLAFKEVIAQQALELQPPDKQHRDWERGMTHYERNWRSSRLRTVLLKVAQDHG